VKVPSVELAEVSEATWVAPKRVGELWRFKARPPQQDAEVNVPSIELAEVSEATWVAPKRVGQLSGFDARPLRHTLA